MLSATMFPSVFSSTVSNYAKTTHSQPSKRDYAVTAKALDYGQYGLSPAVIRTYRVLCDLDFADRSTGLCKGSVWHASETLAQYLSRSVRTIQRHLVALEQAGLVVRRRRQNRSTVVRLLACAITQAAPVDNVSPQTTKMSFAYKGNRETKRNNNTKKGISLDTLRRFEAKCDAVVTQLVGFGYDFQQAISDFVQFGKEELALQLANLSAYIQAGKVFGSCAKWLNWAIRSKHRIDHALNQTPSQVPKATSSATPVEDEYELITDEQGYVGYRPRVTTKSNSSLAHPQSGNGAPQISQPISMALFIAQVVQPSYFKLSSRPRAFVSFDALSITCSTVQGTSRGAHEQRTMPPPPHPLLAAWSAASLDHTPTASLHTSYVGTVVKRTQRVRRWRD